MEEGARLLLEVSGSSESGSSLGELGVDVGDWLLGGGARLLGCLQFRCRRPSDGSAYGRDKAYPSPDFPGKIHGGVAG